MTDSAVLPPFTVTPAAIDAITDVGGAVRVSLTDGGCCGTFYRFDTADAEAAPPAEWRRRTGWRRGEEAQ